MSNWFSKIFSGAETTRNVPRDPVAAQKQILQLVNDGKTIDAIKLYRETHHVGLKEAKDAVEAMRAVR